MYLHLNTAQTKHEYRVGAKFTLLSDLISPTRVNTDNMYTRIRRQQRRLLDTSDNLTIT